MNRRSLLKAIGIVPIAAVAAPLVPLLTSRAALAPAAAFVDELGYQIAVRTAEIKAAMNRHILLDNGLISRGAYTQDISAMLYESLNRENVLIGLARDKFGGEVTARWDDDGLDGD